MMNLLFLGERFCVRRLLSAWILLSCCSAAAQGANNITGTVINQSRRGPAAGDEVVLVRLDRWPQQEARARTDARGAFTLAVAFPDRRYVVRVFHQGVTYDHQASVGDALLIRVFDAAFGVRDVTGNIEILRAGTEANRLHVSDMYEISNDSNPPRTEVGRRTFEAYLPASAKIDSVLAAGPGNVGMMISAVPVPDEPGHWAVNFPLKPGATKFAFNYNLPYDGHAAFHLKHAYRFEQVAVMIPPTMSFSSGSPSFEILAVDSSPYQVRAANHLEVGEGAGFELSGTGDLPPLGNEAKSEALLLPSRPSDSAPSAHSLIAEPSWGWIGSSSKLTQPPSQSLALGVVACGLLAVCAVLVWRARKGPSLARSEKPQPGERKP
jgi:hypothetical protein